MIIHDCQLFNYILFNLTPPPQALPVPDPPVGVQAILVTETTAIVTWAAPSFDPNNLIAFYNLTLQDEQFGLPDVQVMYTGSMYQYMFTGLEEYANYTCDIISVGVFGTFSFPSSVTFTTLEAGTHSSVLNH